MLRRKVLDLQERLRPLIQPVLQLGFQGLEVALLEQQIKLEINL